MAEEHNVHYQEQQQHHQQLQLRDSLQPIDLNLLRLNTPAAAAVPLPTPVTARAACQFYHHHHHHPNYQPCIAATTPGSNNSMKRRSPDTSYAERRAKKHFLDQDSLALQGFSSVSLPMSLASLTGNCSHGRPVLRRCVSDPTKPPTLAEGLAGGSPATAAGNGLPPLPPSLRRTVSDVTPSPPKILSGSLSSEETTITPDSSMKVQKMKERLKEVLQLCHEALESEEEEEEKGGREEERKAEEEKEEEGKVRGEGEELGECVVADYDNNEVPTQDNDDNLKGEEEAVSVEWADKCLRVIFRCPCGKGYEVLLSENTCYYKLV